MTLTRALRTIGIFAAAALLVGALGMKPLHAMGTDNPPAPTDDGGKKKKKKPSAIEQPPDAARRRKNSCATTAPRAK